MEQSANSSKGYRSLTVAEVKELIHYDPESGVFRWKDGNVAGATHSSGYLQTYVAGHKLSLHRLAWFITYGRWPVEIDHINRVKTDNRISNLRNCTRSENAQNRLLPKGKSGLKGAFRYHRKWKSQIYKNRKCVYLGLFNTKREAHAAYCEAAKSIYGLHANTESAP